MSIAIAQPGTGLDWTGLFDGFAVHNKNKNKNDDDIDERYGLFPLWIVDM